MMSDNQDDGQEDRRLPVRVCPVCRKLATAAMRPFCSRRCADIDLHHWLAGTYALPATPDDEEDSQADEDQQA
jgi:endogenous inhibitor of DNA gyrase (YacG/DUF329 family)